MNYKRIGWFLGIVLLIEIALMLPSLLFTANSGDHQVTGAFLKSIAITGVAALLLLGLTRSESRRYAGWEMFLCAGLSYVAVCLTGALPFWFSGHMPSYIDSLFEITSGFTTTGASLLSDVSDLGPGLLFWRSFSQWVGGLAVLLFFLQLLPNNSYRRGHLQELIQSASLRHKAGSYLPMVSRTTERILLIYAGLTLLDMLLLKLSGMPMFDACCIAFGTASTGGFTVLNTGLTSYPVAAKVITLLFMLLFGINYALYLLGSTGNYKQFLRDEEFRAYLLLILLSSLLVAWSVYRRGDAGTVLGALGSAAFQVTSIITTTGFTVTNFAQWSGLALTLLYLLLWCGGCTGSTSGGIKIGRALLLSKDIHRTMVERLEPNRVMVIRLNGKTVSESTMRRIVTFLTVYFMVVIASFLIISADPNGLSIDANFSAVIACINNTGTGIAEISAQGSYATFSPLSKIVLILDMLVGRLEFYPLAALVAAVVRKG